jgi:hypothetical protein
VSNAKRDGSFEDGIVTLTGICDSPNSALHYHIFTSIARVYTIIVSVESLSVCTTMYAAVNHSHCDAMLTHRISM